MRLKYLHSEMKGIKQRPKLWKCLYFFVFVMILYSVP